MLRELCEFVDVDFDPAMLRAHEGAARRLAQLPEARPFGDGVFTRAGRIEGHRYAAPSARSES